MKATYRFNCVRLTKPRDFFELRSMIKGAVDITRRTFVKHVDRADLQDRERSLGYEDHPSRGLTMAGDWHVRYCRGTWYGKRAYYFVHNAIEYVFVMDDETMEYDDGEQQALRVPVKTEQQLMTYGQLASQLRSLAHSITEHQSADDPVSVDSGEYRRLAALVNDIRYVLVMRRFHFCWKNGKEESGEGFTRGDALSSLGYGPEELDQLESCKEVQ